MAEGRKSFGQVLGLDPKVALLTFIVDVMLNSGEIASMGLLVPFSLLAGVVMGFITYKAQMRWYQDDRHSALIKGMALGLLTAIPTALPAVVYMPAGALGLIHNARRERD